ncbi:MAG: AI-2E family transporter [Sandarakinorhabdus sp.]|nr:AI-2E family transporter [Sandarakinorhabdus sp.]
MAAPADKVPDQTTDAVPPPSPIEPRSETARASFEAALIWIGTAALFWLAWQLAEALLLVFAGLVFAAGLREAETQLGRIWKVGHATRLTAVVVLFLALLIGFFAFAGVTMAGQAQTLTQTVTQQVTRLGVLAHDFGIDIGHGGDAMAALKGLVEGQFDRLASFIGSTLGGLGALLLIVTLGIYVAADPRLYERGVEWLTPAHARRGLHASLFAMSNVLRRWVVGRLLTMLIEGSFIFVGLSIVGVPLAGLLGLVSGVLAFIPNLGAMISGVLIIAVGFSVGPTEGLWAFGIYLFVQLVEGNVLTPLIEKRAVDLAPAAVLAAQLLFGILFGILGVALADPIVALAKVALERRSKAAEPDAPPTR